MLTRRAYLKAGKPPRRETPLAPMSSKRAAELAATDRTVTSTLAPMSAKRAAKLAAAGVRATSTLLPSRYEPAVPKPVADRLAERSGGLCEIRRPSICRRYAVDPSHRIPVGAGGVHGEAKSKSDRLSNLMHSCRPCHRWVHRWPHKAKAAGLAMVKGEEPTQRWVLYRGRRVWLDDLGNVIKYSRGVA